jgi:4-hydroxyphenylpyruvate dioxygenase
MNQTQIAINTITLKQAAFEECVIAIAAAGFKLVEFHIPLVKNWMKEKGRTAKDAKAFLDQHGLRCVGGFETHLAVFDDKARAENHALLIANSKLLAELSGGAKTVMVIGTDGPTERPSLDDLAVIGKTARELAEQLPESCSLAVEFNWSPVVKSVRSAFAVAQAANHPRVGILFDPAHYHCTSSKLEDLRAPVVQKILHVHVDDMRDKPGELSHCNADRVLPGEGSLDLKQLLGRLEQHGYKGLFSLELFNEDLWQMPAAKAAPLCYASMKKLCEK